MVAKTTIRAMRALAAPSRGGLGVRSFFTFAGFSAAAFSGFGFSAAGFSLTVRVDGLVCSELVPPCSFICFFLQLTILSMIKYFFPGGKLGLL